MIVAALELVVHNQNLGTLKLLIERQLLDLLDLPDLWLLRSILLVLSFEQRLLRLIVLVDNIILLLLFLVYVIVRVLITTFDFLLLLLTLSRLLSVILPTFGIAILLLAFGGNGIVLLSDLAL